MAGMNVDVTAPEARPYEQIRQEVGKLCSQFPGEFWRRLDREGAYPAEFFQALTDAGYLGALSSY
jgi:acyl-CoA dehydrogenase